MNIPYVDLKARNARQRAELMRAIGEVISSGASCSGNAIDTFEHALAEACGTTHAVAVGSGTEALWFALLAHGIGRGDEVITVPMTSSSTLEAILLVGARPVFADIDPHTYTMDPEAFARAVGTRTKAVIPSHLFGQMAEIDPILAIARESGISVIEDASDALGADDHGRRAGSLGHCGCFGFHPENNPGALGHAGAVVTNDAVVAARIRSWCDQGRNGTNRHRRPEWTGGMDAIQAAVLAVRLRHCDKDHARRRSHASIYRQSLAGVPGIISPAVREGTNHAHQAHALRVAGRMKLLTLLDAHEIGHRVPHALPLHIQPTYRFLGHRTGDFPASKACAREFVALPVQAELERHQIDTVADLVREACGATVAA